MSRIARIAFLAAAIVALTIVAGLDLRLALATRDLSVETSAALDQHERHPNGMSVVITSKLDEHERRAASAASDTATAPAPAILDEHERRAASQASATVTASVPAKLDEHERRASSR
jgi:hypothetical protein